MPQFVPFYVSSQPLIWAGPLVLMLGATALWAALRGYRAGAVAMVLMTAIDSGGWTELCRVAADHVAGRFCPAAKLSARHAGLRRGRIGLPSGGRSARRQPTLAWWLSPGRRIRGLEPRRQLDYWQPEAQRVANVHWRPADRPKEAGWRSPIRCPESGWSPRRFRLQTKSCRRPRSRPTPPWSKSPWNCRRASRDGWTFCTTSRDDWR